MPSISTRNVFEIARKAKVFLNLDAGVTRGRIPGETSAEDPVAAENERLRAELASAKRENARLNGRLVLRDAKEESGVEPERIVWSFGFGRTGSSWMNAMLSGLEGHKNWGEPLVGKLFSDLYYSRTGDLNRENRHFIVSEPLKEVWLKSIRSFVMDGVNARFPELSGGGYLMATDPNGSVGAPLIMQALPESRMILLVRDPRDVVASFLDASRKGSWLNNWTEAKESAADKDPDTFVAHRAISYMQHMGNAKEAYEAHEGRKVMVKYEELRTDTSAAMKRILSGLDLPFDEGNLEKIIAKYAWENIPDKRKGQGKFMRKAKPGGWREDLTRKQAGLVERETAQILNEFYSA